MTLILTFSFILLATISCLVLIMARNINPILKVGLIVISIWYGVAIYFLPGYLAGFPKAVDELPDKCWILSHRVVEPKGMKEGGMYFWVVEKIEEEFEINRLNPMLAFKNIQEKSPRSYKIPYDRELHKKLEKAKQQGKNGKIGMLQYRKGKKGSPTNSDAERDDKDKGSFEIINPVQLLPPKD